MSITYCIEISNNNIFITNESLVYYENDEMKNSKCYNTWRMCIKNLY